MGPTGFTTSGAVVVVVVEEVDEIEVVVVDGLFLDTKLFATYGVATESEIAPRINAKSDFFLRRFTTKPPIDGKSFANFIRGYFYQ